MPLYILLLLFTQWGMLQQEGSVMHIMGVCQGKTLFIQNPYNPKTDSFCISNIYINNIKQTHNYRTSAIRINFKGVSQNAPVSIRIIHRSGCKPIVINPDAILYHSYFSFKELIMTDSTVIWKTVGDKRDGLYVIERYNRGFWTEEDSVASKAEFGGATYQYYPRIEEGANKLRIKYIYPDGNYLYSSEVDYHFYPEPVTFRPFKTSNLLTFSRVATFEIFDGGGNLVLTGDAKTVDVSRLPRGEYVIYFNNKDPGVFLKE